MVGEIEFLVRKIKLNLWLKGFKIIIKMGFKSATQRRNTSYKVGGLIFSSKDRYEDLKGIDSGVEIILSDINDEEELQEFFNNISPIEVIETYPEAREEMDGLFPNITRFLCYEFYGTSNKLKKCYKFADMFFSKFNYRQQ